MRVSWVVFISYPTKWQRKVGPRLFSSLCSVHCYTHENGQILPVLLFLLLCCWFFLDAGDGWEYITRLPNDRLWIYKLFQSLSTMIFFFPFLFTFVFNSNETYSRNCVSLWNNLVPLRPPKRFTFSHSHTQSQGDQYPGYSTRKK